VAIIITRAQANLLCSTKGELFDILPSFFACLGRPPILEFGRKTLYTLVSYVSHMCVPFLIFESFTAAYCCCCDEAG